jgi:molecular chaperone GrpE
MANKLKELFSKVFGEYSHFDDLEKPPNPPEADKSSGFNDFFKNIKNNFNHKMEQTEIPVEHSEAADQMPQDTAAENTSENTAEATAETQETNKFVELEGQVSELKDKYLRLAAEFDNYKRRMAKERVELLDSAAKDTITALLPVLDDFDRAAKANETASEIGGVIEGFKLIHTRIFNILKQRGLKEMETANQNFDADLHEAIAELPMGDDLKGKVFDTTEKGYFLHEKIIRFAKVVVGK